jgi:hypothetical protein
MYEFSGEYGDINKTTYFGQKVKYDYEIFYNSFLPPGFGFQFRLTNVTHDGAGNLKINCLSINPQNKTVVLSFQEFNTLTVIGQPELKMESQRL